MSAFEPIDHWDMASRNELAAFGQRIGYMSFDARNHALIQHGPIGHTRCETMTQHDRMRLSLEGV